MREAVQTVGWLACVVYSTIPAFWLMIHPFAERWRTRQRSPYRVLVPLWVAMWVVVALTTEHWRQVALYRTPWAWIPAGVLFAIGLYLYARSSKNFSHKQLGGIPEIHSDHQEQKLVTDGIRAHVRHPVYLAHLCEMLAWSLGTGLVVCWGLTAFAVITGAVMIRMEDAELEGRFPEEYRNYRMRVPVILPRVFPRTTKPEIRPPIREIVEDLLQSLAPGAASITEHCESDGQPYITISPKNRDSALIWAYGGGRCDYQLDLGAGTSLEMLDEQDVREICTAVFAGKFEETIWSVDTEVTKTHGRICVGQRVLRMTHSFASFHPLRKKEKRFVKYAPYLEGMETSIPSKSPHAL